MKVLDWVFDDKTTFRQAIIAYWKGRLAGLTGTVNYTMYNQFGDVVDEVRLMLPITDEWPSKASIRAALAKAGVPVALGFTAGVIMTPDRSDSEVKQPSPYWSVAFTCPHDRFFVAAAKVAKNVPEYATKRTTQSSRTTATGAMDPAVAMARAMRPTTHRELHAR